MRPAEVMDWIKNAVEVPAEDLDRRIVGDSQSIFENQIHWARFYLAKAGLVASPKRGLWALTQTGRDANLTSDAAWNLYVRIRDQHRSGVTDEATTPAPESATGADGPSYWFAGAMWDGGDDQTERFRTEGIWRNGYEDQFNELVARMKPGDRIAIKSAFVQKRSLPFDVGGSAVSCMRIKATGTITGHGSDAQTVMVNWDPPSKPRDWYFFTYRVTLAEADPENEKALKLIEFAFNGQPQDYDWWLKQPYWAAKYATRPVVLRGDDGSTDGEDDTDPEEAVSAYSIGDIIAEGSFLSPEVLTDILNRWRAKKNLILQGPPGTGKSFLAKRLGYALIGSRHPETTRSRLRVVQFHPSFAYEDFVRGWRPKGRDGLDLVDGLFLQAVDAATSEPDQAFVLVIEEINRGNPAQIFGELLTLLEAGKRRKEEAIELSYRRNDGERVFVPGNLHVIGTMNVADRSLALVDLALRRRFAFVDLEPILGDRWESWCVAHGVRSETVALIRERMNALNAAISSASSLGPQFRVGHSYVTPEEEERVADGRSWFRAKVETEIAPLLEEYWFDAPDTARKARSALLSGL